MIYEREPELFDSSFEVVSCYVVCNERILILLRQENKPEGNKWGAPAGKIEEGEEEYGAIIREIREETGLSITREQLNYLSKVYVRYPKYDFVYHMFLVNLDLMPEVILNPKEHKDFKWVFPNEALKMNLVLGMDECIRMKLPQLQDN